MQAPGLDPELLKAFIAVCDTRSFTRAASSLNRTQSAVSMQVKRLEDRLQLLLFRRTTARVELTAAGERLEGYARRIIQLSDEAVGNLRDYEVKGRVRLGAMEDYGTLILPSLVNEFVKAHPGVQVEMEVGLTSTMQGRLGEDFDLVLAMHPAGHGDGEFLRREKTVWAGSRTISISGHLNLPVALSAPGCLVRKWAIDALDSAGRPWQLAFVSQSQAAVEAIVAEGLAITALKAGTFPSRLRMLPTTEGLPNLPDADIHLHQATRLKMAASVFAGFLSEKLRAPR